MSIQVCVPAAKQELQVHFLTKTAAFRFSVQYCIKKSLELMPSLNCLELMCPSQPSDSRRCPEIV
jgi:hypothetical protein